jgi:iron complex transport system ATP-binding protein
VDLEVRKGEITQPRPNAAGRPRAQLLNRNLKPQKGRVLMKGVDLEEISKRKIARHIAVVPQSNEIRFAFTVRDIVSMGRMPFLSQFQGESRDDMQIVEEAMEKTSIKEFADRLISNMSGGERQRVIIARALAQSPEIILRMTYPAP